MMVTKFRLQWVIVNESGHEQVQEVARIEREGVEMETLGLTLAEGLRAPGTGSRDPHAFFCYGTSRRRSCGR